MDSNSVMLLIAFFVGVLSEKFLNALRRYVDKKDIERISRLKANIYANDLSTLVIKCNTKEEFEKGIDEAIKTLQELKANGGIYSDCVIK